MPNVARVQKDLNELSEAAVEQSSIFVIKKENSDVFVNCLEKGNREE